MPVHCLPLLGTWQYERLAADSDLHTPMGRADFVALSRSVLEAAGTAVERFGAHSIRKGAAGALFHQGLGIGAVATTLRRHSPASAYVSDATRMSDAAEPGPQDAFPAKYQAFSLTLHLTAREALRLVGF